MSRVATALFFWASLWWGPAHAGMGHDDPLRGMFTMDRLERSTSGAERTWTWEADGWVGYDLRKLWLKTEGEYVDRRTEEAEVQLLFSHAIAPYWDVQVGWRTDFEPDPERNWLALGLQGIAPWWFEVDTAAYIGESGRIHLRAEADYEVLLTRQWVLVPRLEANWYSKRDPDLAVGDGLARVEGGLRLRYHFAREFAPYIGIRGFKLHGATARFGGARDQESDDMHFLLGIHFWF